MPLNPRNNWSLEAWPSLLVMEVISGCLVFPALGLWFDCIFIASALLGESSSAKLSAAKCQITSPIPLSAVDFDFWQS